MRDSRIVESCQQHIMSPAGVCVCFHWEVECAAVTWSADDEINVLGVDEF